MNRFINAARVLNTTDQVIYTCPENSYAVIHTIYFSTTDENDCKNITMKIRTAQTGQIFNIAFKTDLPPKTTLSFEKPINLSSNDELIASAGSIGDVHMFVSIMHVIPMSL